MALQTRDDETRQVGDILDKQKKALVKEQAKLKKSLKDKSRELLRLKGELNEVLCLHGVCWICVDSMNPFYFTTSATKIAVNMRKIPSFHPCCFVTTN